ncbi:CBU_0592 family membrane protein [Marinoscillum sp.]|uniref:CBU_0592 family membrane protein n=1 Tax=Marinoscillum sp. TaxID=2024838 RepID=UPI003BAD7C38
MNSIEIIGWCGAALLLLGFSLNVFHVITAKSRIYLLLNLVSSAMLLYNAYMNGIFPFVVVNSVWVLFSGYQLMKGAVVSHS